MIEKLQCLHPARQLRELLPSVLTRAGLDADHADDHRQMVLHPVLHFGELLLHLAQRHMLAVSAAVVLDSDEIPAIAIGIFQRAHHQPVPEPLPTGAIIVDRRLDIGSFSDGATELFHRGWIGILPLQKAAIAPEDGRAGIAGHLLERPIDENQRFVGLFEVGNGKREWNAVPCRLVAVLVFHSCPRFPGATSWKEFLPSQ